MHATCPTCFILLHMITLITFVKEHVIQASIAFLFFLLMLLTPVLFILLLPSFLVLIVLAVLIFSVLLFCLLGLKITWTSAAKWIQQIHKYLLNRIRCLDHFALRCLTKISCYKNGLFLTVPTMAVRCIICFYYSFPKTLYSVFPSLRLPGKLSKGIFHMALEFYIYEQISLKILYFFAIIIDFCVKSAQRGGSAFCSGMFL